MKKPKLLKNVCLCVLLVGLVSSCDLFSSSDISDAEYRRVAWNYLSDAEKETVIIDPDEAPVERNVEYIPFNDEDERPRRAVSVRFNTRNDPVLGPILVYVRPDAKEVFGTAPRF